MTPEDRSRMRELLLGQPVMALGVVVDGEPVVGLVPYAVTTDCSALVIQASRLARHSQGLKPDGAWSGVIHEPITETTDPLQVARVTLEGHVEPLHGGTAAFDECARAFLSRVPAAAQTLALGDFSLYRLRLEGGRLILGFGAALNLSRSHFTDLAKS